VVHMTHRERPKLQASDTPTLAPPPALLAASHAQPLPHTCVSAAAARSQRAAGPGHLRFREHIPSQLHQPQPKLSLSTYGKQHPCIHTASLNSHVQCMGSCGDCSGTTLLAGGEAILLRLKSFSGFKASLSFLRAEERPCTPTVSALCSWKFVSPMVIGGPLLCTVWSRLNGPFSGAHTWAADATSATVARRPSKLCRRSGAPCCPRLRSTRAPPQSTAVDQQPPTPTRRAKAPGPVRRERRHCTLPPLPPLPPLPFLRMPPPPPFGTKCTARGEGETPMEQPCPHAARQAHSPRVTRQNTCRRDPGGSLASLGPAPSEACGRLSCAHGSMATLGNSKKGRGDMTNVVRKKFRDLLFF